MKQLLSVVMLMALMGGCAKTDAPVGVASTNSVIAPNQQTVESTKPTAYPEKTEVERLLIRAGQHQQQGEFEKALTLVKEALQADPNSPSAATMQANLEDILRKI